MEHIFSQDEKGQLEKVDISILGNLTLLELKNSKNGHKGNCSIKNKPFTEKKELAYKNSCNELTRRLYNYENFNEDTIIERTKELFEILEEFTRI